MPTNNLGDISFDNSGQQQAHNVGHVSYFIIQTRSLLISVIFHMKLLSKCVFFNFILECTTTIHANKRTRRCEFRKFRTTTSTQYWACKHDYFIIKSLFLVN